MQENRGKTKPDEGCRMKYEGKEERKIVDRQGTQRTREVHED